MNFASRKKINPFFFSYSINLSKGIFWLTFQYDESNIVKGYFDH